MAHMSHMLPQASTPSGVASGSSSRTMSLMEKQKYIEDYDFPYCDESSKYEKVAKIGQGTFGYVTWPSKIHMYIMLNKYKTLIPVRFSRHAKRKATKSLLP